MLGWSLLGRSVLLCLGSVVEVCFHFFCVFFSDYVVDDVGDYFDVFPGIVGRCECC